MHPILEIALGVALGMTIFLVVVWVLGMTVYVCCNKNECIASCNKSAKFSGNKETIIVSAENPVQEIAETSDVLPVEESTESSVEPLKESETS